MVMTKKLKSRPILLSKAIEVLLQNSKQGCLYAHKTRSQTHSEQEELKTRGEKQKKKEKRKTNLMNMKQF